MRVIYTAILSAILLGALVPGASVAQGVRPEVPAVDDAGWWTLRKSVEGDTQKEIVERIEEIRSGLPNRFRLLWQEGTEELTSKARVNVRAVARELGLRDPQQALDVSFARTFEGVRVRDVLEAGVLPYRCARASEMLGTSETRREGVFLQLRLECK